MTETDEKLERIISELEEGKTVGISDLEFLTEVNEGNPIVEFLFGSGSGIVDTLSSTARATLSESIQAQGEEGIIISRDLGLISTEPFFTGGSRVAKGTAEIIGSSRASAVGKKVVTDTALKRSVGRWIWENKGKIGLGGLALWGGGSYLFGGDDDPTTQAVQTATGPPDQDQLSSQPNDFIVIDPQTGQQVPISQIDPGLNVSNQVQGTFGSGNFGSDIQAFAAQQGVDLNSLGFGFGGIEQINPLFFGEQKVSPTEFPSGVDVRGQAIQDPQSFIQRRGQRRDPTLNRFLPEEDLSARAAYGIAAPPGAQLNPAFFGEIAPAGTREVEVEVGTSDRGEYQGPYAGRTVPGPITRTGTVTTPSKTLSTEAAAAANEFGVPIDILYGVINATSGWNPSAVGNSGTTYGLGQIDEQRIDRNAAQNPRIALRFVARSLASNFNQYGSWELSALEYRSEGAAARLLADGTIDKVNKSWLGDALESAAKSGLGNNIFDFASLAALSTRGDGDRAGPTIPPFQEPDRATLRETARRAVQSIYGRESSGDELTGFVDQLMQGYREAYEQQVIGIKGGTPMQVDPQARLLDELRTSGEGQFRTERTQQRSMMDKVSEWARILQEA